VDECKPLCGGRLGCHGRAVQVDPIKPTLKPPGTKRLKLECDGLLSNFGFKFSSRRYTMAARCKVIADEVQASPR